MTPLLCIQCVDASDELLQLQKGFRLHAYNFCTLHARLAHSRAVQVQKLLLGCYILSVLSGGEW